MTIEAPTTEAAPTTTPAPDAPPAGAPATPPVDPNAPPPVDPKLAPRFAELARREREWTQKQTEAKAKLEAADAFEAARTRATEDPLVALELLGIPFDKLVDAVLNKDKPQSAEDRVSKLEAQIAADKKAAEDRVAQEKGAADKAAIESFQAQIAETVAADAAAFPFVNAKGAFGTVFEVVELHYQKTGEIFAIPEAAKLVEDHLRKQAQAEYETYAKLFASSATAPASAPGVPAVKPPAFGAKDVAADPAPTAPPPARETREEKLARISKSTSEREAARQSK